MSMMLLTIILVHKSYEYESTHWKSESQHFAGEPSVCVSSISGYFCDA
jgi:hypothetical protein